MKSSLSGRFSLLALAVCAVLASQPAAAQSDLELRQENQRLRGEVERLERELQAARDRIADLDARIQQLREQLASGGDNRRPPSEEPEEERVSIDETEPDASPRALLKELETRYSEQFSEMEPGEPGSRERELYLRALDQWIAGMAREYRMPVTWHVKILRQTGEDRASFFVEMVAVDPKFGTQLGERFDAIVPRIRARNITDPEAVYEMKGTLVPRLRINPERATAGTFDFPRLVGPYVEYIIGVEVSTIVPAPPPTDESDDGDQGADDDDGGGDGS